MQSSYRLLPAATARPKHHLTFCHVLLQPSQLSSPAPALQADAEAYLPMSACLTRCSLDASDGYLPMRPLGGPGAGLEAPPRGHSPLRGPQDDLLPPPINRHLKPRQRGEGEEVDGHRAAAAAALEEHFRVEPGVQVLE
jgi:hypothetical protein